MFELSSKWTAMLEASAETGMSYQVVSITLKDGRRFDQVVIVGGSVVQIRGMVGIPFSNDDIQEVVVTHEKWDFNAE